MSTYQNYKNILAGEEFPYACLDMDLFKKNIQINLERAGDKKIRIASKSIRCPELIQQILDTDTQFQGIMAYHGREALFLAEQGFDDILLGYPIVDKKLLMTIGKQLLQKKYICLMVDSPAHLEIIEALGKNLGIQIPICLDIDLSQNYPGLRFGVWRSQIENEKILLAFLAVLKKTKHIRLDGLMGYEAQIAGLGDFANGNFLLDGIVRLLKQRALSKISPWRQKAVSIIQDQGFTLQFVNGGGTGSLETTSEEEAVTEVTVGSGFFCSHLFDYYQNFKLHPALFYALQIVRRPQKNIFTVHGGGFIASGGIDKKKEPIVHLPAGGRLDANEGAGEVQTPIFFQDADIALKIGDPVFLRHAKAGELCERFNKLVLLDGGEKKEVFTYRGLGQCFG